MSDAYPAAPANLRSMLTSALLRHAPRGAVRAAEALAATALNRHRRAARLWQGALAEAPPRFDELFAALPEQPLSARADLVWSAACRRIAARALAGAGPDPTRGAHDVAPHDAPPPEGTGVFVEQVGPFAFYRRDSV